MKSALIELHYLPSLEYFCALQDYSSIQLEKHEYFVKQSYRNRCYINTAQGIEMLTVPLTNKHGKVAIGHVKIDYRIKWQNNHWRTIESAYRKAPFFEYYSDDLKKIIYAGHIFLFDLNLALLSFCLKSISCRPELSVSVAYEKKPETALLELQARKRI